MKNLFALLFLFLAQVAIAQKKDFSDEQMIRNSLPEISKPLAPARWMDENTYCIGTKCYDTKTGAEKPIPNSMPGASRDKSVRITNNDIYMSTGTMTPVRLTFDSIPKFNATFSPDTQYIAFTRKNDLYTIDINTKKVNRLLGFHTSNLALSFPHTPQTARL